QVVLPRPHAETLAHAMGASKNAKPADIGRASCVVSSWSGRDVHIDDQETRTMERRTAGEFDQELLNLFDLYVHGGIDRRGFLERAAKFAVGGMTAAMLLDALSPRFAEAQQVAKDDKRLRTEWIDYESPQGTGKVRAYLARPESTTGKLPGILVVHENRGLNPHIEDITRRLALDNFVVLAPDALTPLGGYPGDGDKARKAFAKLDQARSSADVERET